jgi:hypothetical protein
MLHTFHTTRTQLDNMMVLMTSKFGENGDRNNCNIERENPMTKMPSNERDHHCPSNKVLHIRYQSSSPSRDPEIDNK